MAKLTDKQRKQILAESVEGSSVRALAAKYGVSTTTIQKIRTNSSEELKQKITQKKEENLASVLSYMDSKKNDVCKLIDVLLNALNDPDKIAATPLAQIATTMGIVIDKYTANEALQPSDTQGNNLFEAINACGEEGIDDLPEIQQQAENDAPVVEDGQAPT